MREKQTKETVIVREFGKAPNFPNQPGRWKQFVALPEIFRGSMK
jgi:hypothetical protein